MCPVPLADFLASWTGRYFAGPVMKKILIALWLLVSVASTAAYIVPREASLDLRDQAIESGFINPEIPSGERDAAEVSKSLQLQFDMIDSEAAIPDLLFFCAVFAALLTAFGLRSNGLRALPGFVVVAGLLGAHSAVLLDQQYAKARAYNMIVQKALPSSGATVDGVDWSWASDRAGNEFMYDDKPPFVLNRQHHLGLWFLVALFGWMATMYAQGVDVTTVRPGEEPS